MKTIKIFVLILSLLFLTNCGDALKFRKVDAKEYPPDPKLRVQKNIEEGRGFRLMGNSNNNNTNYNFASSNPLWRATLDTLDFMPLVSANYSGGIVITDWYSENNSPNQAIKISIRFLTNEIRSDALDINIFVKECNSNLACQVNQSDGDLRMELASNILKKAALYEKNFAEQYKKNNPYTVTTPDNKRSTTTN
jgi:hypothetical protein